MPRTDPLPQWQGPAYLIGGGASLRHFSFGQLRGRQVIGCNQAFLLGSAVVPVAIFGDFKFWCHYARELRAYAGWVVSPRHTLTHQADWIHFFERQNEGLSPDKLAWNGNTGAAAINLALILGASPVYLLGYDCGMSEGEADASRPESSHWHDERLETPSPEHYARFAAGFDNAARALPAVFPGRKVLNVTDGSSRLSVFPRVSFVDAGLGGEV